MKKAVVYARYSSHRQGEQSIEGQLAAAYKYANENGYKIVHEYIDRAMTGRNDNREQFQKMLKDTSKK
ncbi:MAG: recombinase family protein, partial [Clostridia bacterium]|nr:recombinase family protein [Clostridia bacterium]